MPALRLPALHRPPRTQTTRLRAPLPADLHAPQRPPAASVDLATHDFLVPNPHPDLCLDVDRPDQSWAPR